MSDLIRAIVVDPDAPGRLSVQAVQPDAGKPGDLSVRVTAISLNRGEVKRAVTASEAGARPGWDFAGVVEEASSTGEGPNAGTRVVGFLREGAWAERVRVAPHAVAALPDAVTDAQAATLPVAGLTALHALRQGGLLLGKKVLVDGASGGAGHFAVQLASAAGARVYAYLRREIYRPMVEPWCNDEVIVAPTIEAARSSGPYDLIIDSVGGTTLGAAMTMLETCGTCVTFGVSEAPTATFESGRFFRAGGVRLYGLIIFDELVRTEPAGKGLAVLVQLIADGKLTPHIDVETSWKEIGRVATDLIDRKFAGKAVLHID